MKFYKVGMVFLTVLSLSNCTTSKVVSINSELMVIEATKTSQEVRRAPGARLNFTVVSNKEISLDSVYYWEKKHPLAIEKTNEDTIWVKAEIRNPIRARELKDDVVDPSTLRPIDSTCVLIYHLKGKSLQLTVPKLTNSKK